MRIVSVEAVPITVGLAKPVVMSHITVERSHNVLARVTTDNGLVGWGEGTEATDLTGDTQPAIAAAIEFIGPRLIGEDPLRRTALWWAMGRMMHANETAKGAIDMALHDIVGKHFGVPVVELLGGRARAAVPALTMVGSGDPDADVEAALAKHDAGFRWFKVKLGIGTIEAELETMRRVREALPADCVLSGDANQGWTEPEAVRFLRALDGLDIRFIEQPIPQGDHAAMVRVARGSPIPICADQSVHSHNDIVAFGRTGVAGVSLKLVKLGGITGVMRGAALCESLGLGVNLAGKIAESSVAAAANVHCAAAMRAVGFGCSPGNQGVSSDVSSDPLVAVNGEYPVPSGPGLGIDVDQV
ncbi:MAG: mandelate racemase/muconate lactonizing enzyme family protein [Acidimicrobiaceae bacterium]|nr:mandelate racemase/muconate lactonizing enzyme family protein [Acidimicrobiaceae bacterium]